MNMKKTIILTESELTNLIKKVIKEQNEWKYCKEFGKPGDNDYLMTHNERGEEIDDGGMYWVKLMAEPSKGVGFGNDFLIGYWFGPKYVDKNTNKLSTKANMFIPTDAAKLKGFKPLKGTIPKYCYLTDEMKGKDIDNLYV